MRIMFEEYKESVLFRQGDVLTTNFVCAVEIRRVIMLLGLKRGTVILEPHNDEWELCAKETIIDLKRILGVDAIDIQHVGSTAIKNIVAKPIIDIVVGVNDFLSVLKHKEELSNAGIIFRGEDLERQLLFVIGDFEKDTRSHHIHVVKWNEKEWINYINFRDYLNANSNAAFEYSKLKEELIQDYSNDRIHYTKGKTKMIDELLEQAARWRVGCLECF